MIGTRAPKGRGNKKQTPASIALRAAGTTLDRLEAGAVMSGMSTGVPVVDRATLRGDPFAPLRPSGCAGGRVPLVPDTLLSVRHHLTGRGTARHLDHLLTHGSRCGANPIATVGRCRSGRPLELRTSEHANAPLRALRVVSPAGPPLRYCVFGLAQSIRGPRSRASPRPKGDGEEPESAGQSSLAPARQPMSC